MRRIRKVHVPFLPWLGLTLPFFGRTLIFHRKTLMGQRTLRHELEHMRQLDRFGSARYLLTHIWARIRTRNLWGRGHWIEDEAYAAGGEP